MSRRRQREQAQAAKVAYRRGLPKPDQGGDFDRDLRRVARDVRRRHERPRGIAVGDDSGVADAMGRLLADRYSQPDEESLDAARAAARRLQGGRLATFDDQVHDPEAMARAKATREGTGVLARWSRGGNMDPKLWPWFLHFRWQNPWSEIDLRLGGVDDRSVAKAYRRSRRTGQLVPRAPAYRWGDRVAESPPLEAIPTSIRVVPMHVIDEADYGFGHCEGCNEHQSFHPVRRTWAGVRRRLADVCSPDLKEHDEHRRWREAEGLMHNRRDGDLSEIRLGYLLQLQRYDGPEPPPWIDAPFYSAEHVASVTGLPTATVVNLVGAMGLMWVDGGKSSWRGFVNRAGLWAVVEAQAMGIVGNVQFPPSKKRVRASRRTRGSVAPGQIFGRVDGAGGLRVVEEDRGRKDNHRYWWCECLRCGSMTSQSVRADRLKSGKTRSCGCLQAETTKANLDDIAVARAKRRQRRGE